MVPALTMTALRILLPLLLVGNSPLGRPLPVPGSDDLYQYDDGTAFWTTWAGLNRGTWFHMDDFYPGAGGFDLAQLEFWFFNGAGGMAWDTPFFLAEVWNGGSGGPETQLDQTSVTAIHYAPCYSTYPSPLQTDPDFWSLINTEMSSGGWPSVLGDNTPQAVNHSFFSDEFLVWEPWIIQGPTANDFMIRASGEFSLLEESTWGSIKALF